MNKKDVIRIISQLRKDFDVTLLEVAKYEDLFTSPNKDVMAHCNSPKSCPKCGKEMYYSISKDAYLCEKCLYVKEGKTS